MSNEYEYDTSGLSSSLLIVTVSIPVLIAACPFVFARREEKTFPCDCANCKDPAGLRKKRRGGARVYEYLFFATILLLLVPLKTVIFKSYEREGAFDPYEILGVSRMAKKPEIADMYRTMVRKAKMQRGDKELQKKRLQELILAQKTLLDDKLRETWEAFGDTSKKRTQTIAIPQWAMSRNMSGVLLALYVLLLGLALPKIVSHYWRRTSLRSRLGVSYQTMELFYDVMRHDSRKAPSLHQMAHLLAMQKYESGARTWKTSAESLEQARKEIEGAFAIPVDAPDAVRRGPEGSSYHAYVLIMAQLSISSKKVRSLVDVDDLRFVQDKTVMMAAALRRMARALDNRGILTSAMQFERCFIQGVPNPSYWRMQYPGVSFEDLFVKEYANANANASANTNAKEDLAGWGQKKEEDVQKKQRLMIDESMFKLRVLSSDLYVPGRGVLRDHDSVSLGEDLIVRVVLAKEDKEAAPAPKEGPPLAQASEHRSAEHGLTLDDINFNEENEFEPAALENEDVFIKGEQAAAEAHAPFMATPQKYRWASYLFVNEHALLETKEFSDFKGNLSLFYKIPIGNKVLGATGKGTVSLGVSVFNCTFFDRDVHIKRLLIIK